MKYSKTLQLFAVLTIASFTLFTACDVSNTSDDGTGQLAVKLTDAPGDYEAVFIDIHAVKVKASENDEEGWITISDENRRVNLLEWQNGQALLLGEEELETGFYHQIRLVLGPDNAVVIDGKTYPLKTPSARQSGLKLNIDAKIAEDEVYVLLLDFNAAESIVKAGNSGQYLLNPVIRTASLGETSSIEGTVEPDSFTTRVLAIANGDTLATYTGDEGDFMFIAVSKGTYEVVFNPPDTVAYSDTTLTDIKVAVDEDVDLGTITLPKK